MIRLSRYQLKEIAEIFVLANTPLSLFKAIVRTSTMDYLRKRPTSELVSYYDFITARARRDEISVALAYAVLFALLIKARDVTQIPIDVSRLAWGEYIAQYLRRGSTSTQTLTLEPPARTPQVETTGSSTGFLLYGPDDRRLTWSNEND